jgi:hypothetical protein
MKDILTEGSLRLCRVSLFAIAKDNIKEAIELYLETLRDEKHKAPEEHLWQGRVEVAM